MPVLYYKADPSKLVHDPTIPPLGTPNPNIYNFDDNYGLTALAARGNPLLMSILIQCIQTPEFSTRQLPIKRLHATPRPHNEDGYILISAGYDGLYGTKDDVFNFAD